jgi:PAS domain S-box-containing protein
MAGYRVRDLHTWQGRDQLFELILEASPDLIYVYDRLEERYLFVSQRSFTMLGYTPQQIMQLRSEDIEEWIHPEDLAHAQAHYTQQDQLGDADTSLTTYRVRHADGDYRLARCRQRVLSQTAYGQVKCILGVGTDITDEARRQAELDGLRTQILRIRDEERRKMALRMHDTAMQHLVGAALLLQGMEARLIDPETARLSEARASLSRALRDMLEPFMA